MVTRRSHTKSRYGCTECRRRKVKCDENRPSCADCTRRGARCKYLSSNTRRDTTSPGRPSPLVPSSSRTFSSHNVPNTLPSFFSHIEYAEEELSPLSPLATKRWATSMELMHHWSTSTAHTMGLRPDMQDVWRLVVPEMGYEHPFVLHGILAVSAIHKAYLLPLQREKYLNIAAYHQTRGLEGFRTALFYVENTDWRPLFCFSSTIVVYVCGLAAHSTREPGSRMVSEVLKLFVLIRGFRSVLLPHQAEVSETAFAPLNHGVWIIDQYSGDFDQDVPLNDSRLPKDIFDSLRSLTEFFQTELPEGSRRDYKIAVAELRKAAVLMAKAGEQLEVGMLLFFPYTVPSSIVADIQTSNPYAMVLLSYFALLLRVVQPSFWFMQRWSEQLFGDIERQLRDNPRLWSVAQWPTQKAMELYK